MKTRTETVTIREGERLGPVDWKYNFQSHDWDHGGAINPDVMKRRVEMLRTLDEESRTCRYEATTDGGWPHVGWGEVTDVAMYDGWPFWEPTPSIRIGSEWTSVFGIVAIRKKKIKEY